MFWGASAVTKSWSFSTHHVTEGSLQIILTYGSRTYTVQASTSVHARRFLRPAGAVAGRALCAERAFALLDTSMIAVKCSALLASVDFEHAMLGLMMGTNK